MSFSVITSALAADVAPAGTFTVAYPSGKNAGNFQLSMAHVLTVGDDRFYFPVDFDISTFGATTMTITNKTTATTWLAGKQFRLQVEEMGERAELDTPLQSPNAQTGTVSGQLYGIDAKSRLIPSTTDCYLNLVALGAPVALDTGGIAAAQSMAAAGTMAINGTLAVSGAVTLDVPRALQVVSSGADTAVITVTGADVYGRAMSEAITLNGATAVLGKKAFKTISLLTNSIAIANLAKVGTTDILGLPIFVPSNGFIIAELMNGNKVGGSGTSLVEFNINQVDLLAGTAQSFISPVAGFITGARAIVSKNTIVTGGNIGVLVGTTAVTGLTLVFADGSVPGTVASDTPTTPFSATTVVAVGSRIQVAPDASFATSGDVNGYVEIAGGSNGTLVAGIRTAGGSTTTTGDVRGTYKPSTATDGSTFWHLILCSGDRYPGVRQNVTGA